MQCGACGDSARPLRVLRCFHSVCQTCAVANKSTGGLKCALCKYVTKDRTFDRLPQNYLANARTRQSPAGMCFNCCRKPSCRYCDECSAMLCADCDSLIHGHRVLALHVRSVIDSSQAEGCLPIQLSCPLHSSRELDLFCVECRTTACQECIEEIHRGHRIHSLKTAFKEASAFLDAAVGSINLRTAGMSHSVSKLRAALDELEQERAQACASTTDAFAKLADAITIRRDVLLSRIHGIATSKASALTAQMATLESCVDANQKTELFLVEGLQKNRGEFPMSTFVDLCSRGGEFLSFLTERQVDDTPCTEVEVSFQPSNVEQLMADIDAFGDVIARTSSERQFPFSALGDHGVLYFFGTGRGTNLYENPAVSKQVHVAASTVGYGQLENIVSTSRSEFSTQNEPFSWVSVELPSRLRLAGYTFFHDAQETQAHFLRTWEVQGWASLTGRWDVIDSRQNDKTITDRSPQGYWNVKLALPDAYRRFRIVSTAPNSSGAHYLMISGVELFGTLID